jgi:tRNA pseudouridine55 synthase
VRSLAHDLGQKLGCGAHLLTLRRVTSGRFDVANAVKFEDVMEMEERDLETRVIPMLKLAAAE